MNLPSAGRTRARSGNSNTGQTPFAGFGPWANRANRLAAWIFCATGIVCPISIAAQNLIPDSKPISGKRALLIGNSQYQHLPTLRTPKANVEALAAALRKASVQVDVAYDLSQAAMIAQVRAFAAAVSPTDFALVYFSGYGYQVDELNYLLPVTFDPADDSPVGQRAFSVRNLRSQLDERKPSAKMLVFDASRNCAGLPGGLANMPPSSATLIAFSAAPNATADDPADGGVNLFTSALIHAIEEPGSTASKTLTRMQSEVERSSGGQQLPFVMQTPVESFYFTEPPPAPPVPPVTVVSRLPDMKPGQGRENPKDQLTYSWIPAGVFKMGCVTNDASCLPDEKPQHEVKINAGFWITRTEVTAEAYARFTRETGHREPKKTQTNPKLMGTDLPVTKVNWDDAKAYCEWAGGRLPTEAEWEYAARGGRSDSKYPWGDQFDPRLANAFKTDQKLKRPFLETVPVRRLGTGNGFNLFDVVGNVREWTSDIYDPRAYSRNPSSGASDEASTSKERVVRGGSFYGADKHLRISARDHLDGTSDDNQTGFRCVATFSTEN